MRKLELLLLLGLSVGTMSSSPVAPASAQSTLLLGGVSVPRECAEACIEELALELASKQTSIRLPDGSLVTRSYQELGASLDKEQLRWLLGHLHSEARNAPLPIVLDPETIRHWLLQVKYDFDQSAASARIELDTGDVIPEQEGIEVDVFETIFAFESALSEGRVPQVQARRVPPARVAADFEGLEFDTLLGEFDTPYNGSGDAEDRTHNLRVAASKVDGVVLFPGEEFDFNAVVGERNLAGGFRPATVIAGGELVDGVGGGACQIAGTLHAAAFFAGLEITDRHPHSRPSSYIKLGLDAAVSYPNLNFRFRNDRETPVLIRLLVQGGQTTAQVFGDSRYERVRFVRRITEFQAFSERTVEDSELPTGVRVLSQRGVPGFTVARYRLVEDVRTSVTHREVSEDSYPPTTQVWRVGTGGQLPEDYEAPVGDQQREYTADEFTIMLQGAGVEGTEVVRRAGRTGTQGWTTIEGMPSAD